MSKQARWIAVIVVIWLATTWLFWLGYTGDDDLFYARYAFLLHRPPIVWWEFRMPAILAIRGSFLVLGPSEFAAALPSLLASAAIVASVAWFVGWPRHLTWQSQGAMLLAVVIPIDAGFRSYPSANQIAAGLLALGTVCILKGASRTQLIGSAFFALGFLTHEISFFYIALFCLAALLVEPSRLWRPVLACVVLSAVLFATECLTYQLLLGDPLARLKTATGPSMLAEGGIELDSPMDFRFFAWPVQNLVFCKQFGFDLIALLLTGAIAWSRLDKDQRILLISTLAVYVWFGYGSQVPWAYKPFYRQFHFYNCLSLGVAALLPYTVGCALSSRKASAKALVGLAVVVHVMSLVATGRWGANADVSRELLRYAQQHPDQRFLTDVNTMNQMYVLGGFQLPDNVVCLNGNATERHLLLNKEPPGTPRYRCADDPINGILVNLEQHDVLPFEREFSDYLRAHAGTRTTIAAVQYRLAFRPLVPVLGSKEFMIRSAGGELIAVTHAR